MTYGTNPNVKINTDAVEEMKKMAKADEGRDFIDIAAEVAKKFNLTADEADKALRKAEYELATELIFGQHSPGK